MKFSLHPRSIAFRLIVAVLAVELISMLLVVVLSFGYERHIHFRAFDVMLRGHADSILGAVQDADDNPADDVVLDQADVHVPPEDVYEVWESTGRLLGRSSNWQGTGPTGPADPRGEFFHSSIDGRHYRLLRMRGSRTVDPGVKGGQIYQLIVVYGSPTRNVWHAIRGAVEFYAAGNLLVLLVTGPLIAWLLQRGLLPLRQLASLASVVTADSWHFSPPASARSTPELAPLTQALESVLQRLEHSFLQQRTFVSDAAHELKTAVAVVKSSLQLLSMKERSQEEYQAGLERCLVDCLRLESLVADMLNLARAESAPPLPDQRQKVDLVACARLAVEHLQTIARLRNVQVRITVPEIEPDHGATSGSGAEVNASGPPKTQTPETGAVELPVLLSSDDCRLLVSNLLLNALQHSPPASIVDLKLTREAGKDLPIASFVVQDHGHGIAPEDLPRVFDRFYRGDPSRTRTTGGTGLGLSIAKAIVQRAGGWIAITSQANPTLPNQGTTVTVRLPIAEPA